MTHFRTEVEVPEPIVKFDFNSELFLIGSCFTENIGAKLSESKFTSSENPFGILYNPESIAQCLSLIMGDYKFTETDLIEQNGVWNSLYHHSRYSGTNKQQMLNEINGAIKTSKTKLASCNYLLITLGTAWVYEYKRTGTVVSNCHKIPASEFNRFRLSVCDITERFNKLFNEIEELNPNVQIIFTVSPVRHLKDGAMENQVSKSTLIMAVSQLVEEFSNIHYFPAYEIMMDDLRDYRFYNDDMLHPSPLAVEYIWQKFKNAWVSKQGHSFITEMNKLSRAIQHRPFQPKADAHQNFLKKQLQKIENLKKKYPNINFGTEIEAFKKDLK